MSNPPPTATKDNDNSICIEKEHISLSPTFDSDQSSISSDSDDAGVECSGNTMMHDECLGMVKLAAPVVATYVLEMLPSIVTLMLVGHVHENNTEEIIGATALSLVYLNLFGYSVGFGLCTAMDTLCSQAFGAGQSHLMGIYLQSGIIVVLFTFAITFILFYYSSEVLMFFGQPVEAAELAGKFIIYLTPGIPFVHLYELLRKILQAQNIGLPMLYVAVFGNIINALVGYYLVYYTNLSWHGAAIARTICNMSLPSLMIPYILWTGCHKSFWTGIHIQEAFRGVVEWLYLGLPGMLQLCFEWWAFEIICIICGLLPNAMVAIGSNAVILNISSLMYMFYLGLSIAGSVRVGNALGAGDAKRASFASWLTIGMSAVTAMFCGTLLLIFRKRLPLLFTHDEEINKMSQTLIGLAAFFQIPDAVNGAVQGVFRGSGRHHIGALLNFAGYYLLGIPVGCVLAFGFHYNVVGLWYGTAAGLVLVSGVGTVLVWRSKWGALAKEAKDRTRGTGSLPLTEVTPEHQKLVSSGASNFGSIT